MSGPYYAAARKRMYCHTRPGVNHVRPLHNFVAAAYCNLQYYMLYNI